MEKHLTHYRFILITGALLLFFHGSAAAIEMPLSKGDPAWQDFAKLWNQRHSGRHTDEMIRQLEKMRQTSPENADIYLWLANVKTFKAREGRSDTAILKEAEKLVCKARDLDPDNPYTLKLLLNILPAYAGKDYLMQHYGPWVSQSAPQKVVRQMPLINDPAWQKAIKDWDQRQDISKALAAVKTFETYAASHPADGMAQVWASRGNYYLGEYYLSMDQFEQSAKAYYLKGTGFGEKAVKLLPSEVRAHYWLMVNESRSIQFDSLINKAQHALSIRTHLIFCLQEDGLYYCGGPSMLEAIGIVAGGKVGAKVMEFIGINGDTVIRELDMAAVLYPEIFYLPYCKALLLAHTGKKAEAAKILDELLKRNPDQSTLYAAENHCILRLSRMLRAEI